MAHLLHVSHVFVCLKPFMEGVIERTVRMTFPGHALYGFVDVVGVITDDLPKDISDYPLVPTQYRPWLFPIDLRNSIGELIVDMTWNIGSNFRSLPLEATGEH